MRRLAVISMMIASLFIHPLYGQGKRGSGEPALDKGLLELPSIGKNDVILVYHGFTLRYNTERLIPDWVAYELTTEEVQGEVPRARGFSKDLDYKDKQAMREDYSNTGWDKGHMAPAADMKWSQTSMYESFFLTNICPQNHELNSRDWHTLEKLCRDWAISYGKIWIVCGPYMHTNEYGTIGNNKVAVPDGFFKAILRADGNKYCSIAFVFENNSEEQPVRGAAVCVNDVEMLVGLDLFHNLNDKIEESVESQCDLKNWNL